MCNGSAIRELFKLGADEHDLVWRRQPVRRDLPVPEIADIIADVMKNAPVSVLQYGLSEGYAAAPIR